MITSCRLDRTVVASFNPRQRNERTTGDSVASLVDEQHCGSSNAAVLVCALTNGSIKVYDKATLQLITTMKADADLISAKFSSSSAVLVAASRNGSVAAFDLRLQQQQQQGNTGSSSSENVHGTPGVLRQQLTNEMSCSTTTGKNTVITSMDCCTETSTAAMGGSLGIHLWDWRQPNRVTLMGETHRNITQVRFMHRNQLVSAGNSLLCVLDCSKASEVALCMMYTGKSTSNFKKMGLCGNEVVYCVSTENCISLWDLSKGQCFHQTGIHHLRQKVRSTNFMNVIVDCSFDERTKTLSLLASNYSGDATVFTLQNTAAYWQPNQRLIGGHRGVVTAWCSQLYTGGNDARICEWKLPSSCSTAVGVPETTMAHAFQPSKRQRFDVE